MKQFHKSCYSINKFHNKAVTFLLSAALLTGLSACGNVNTDGSKGEGTINFHMTNTPAGSSAASVSVTDPVNSGGDLEFTNLDLLQEVNIDVHEVVVGYSAVLTDTISADSVVVGEGHREWITVTESPFILNLLEITNADMLFSEADLPEGFYSEIRLVLGPDNHVVDENGVVHTLRVPSGQQSGYKIKFSSHLHSGEMFDLTINFDAQRSIHVTGNNRYMLQPVLQATRGRVNPE